MKDLVSIRFTAEYFGVCDRTVRNWIAEGRLNAYELGPRLIRLDYEEIRNMPVMIHGTYKKGKMK
jgi:excisionase family DNA binding protein